MPVALIGEQKESKKDVNTRTAQLVQLLTEIGPDIPEIARRLGQFKESVRYRYKEKIVNRGFAVQAAVDHEKFGLRRIIFVVDFGPQYKEYAAAILTAMHELAYISSFAKTLPDGLFVVNASVPVGQETVLLDELYVQPAADTETVESGTRKVIVPELTDPGPRLMPVTV